MTAIAFTVSPVRGNANLLEWRWEQRYRCGHVAEMAIVRQLRPEKMRREAARTLCPACAAAKRRARHVRN